MTAIMTHNTDIDVDIPPPVGTTTPPPLPVPLPVGEGVVVSKPPLQLSVVQRQMLPDMLKTSDTDYKKNCQSNFDIHCNVELSLKISSYSTEVQDKR